jgi:hypothetical protein
MNDNYRRPGLVAAFLAATGLIFIVAFLGLLALRPAGHPQALPTPVPAPTAPAATGSSTGAPPVPPTYQPLPTPPNRDLYDLARRLQPGTAPAAGATPAPPARRVGDREVFWAMNLDTYTPFTVTAVLRFIGQHTLFYFDESISIDQTVIEQTARDFEQRVYPTIRRYFGNEPSPGLDGDPRLTILHAHIPGVAGYFSTADGYPRSINRYSNERTMFYVNIDALRPGTQSYLSVLAHEFTHAVQFNEHRADEGWIQEGLAELGSFLAGFDPRSAAVFLADPDVQLNRWPEQPSAAGRNYGAAYLFLRYLFGRYGGFDRVIDYMRGGSRGLDGLNAYLRPFGVDFERVFLDWTVANLLGRRNDVYGYPDFDGSIRLLTPLRPGETYSGRVNQLGAKYFEITAPGDYRLVFSGAVEAAAVPTQPASGRYFWWGNRGDNIDSTLTREFDLTGLTRATLQFRAWYNLETNWDYAYVEASADGGQSWKVLSGRYSRTDDPFGHSFGPAYTGRSGQGPAPQWVEETVDLTPFAGRKVLIRFEQINDDAVNLEGFAVDDIRIPEAGFFDDAEEDRGWEARGFVRTDNRLVQRYGLRVVKFGRDVTVETVPLGPANRAEYVLSGVGRDFQRAVVVVAGLTPDADGPAQFQLTLSSK